MTNESILDGESLPVYLVAKWSDGSFLRLPAHWEADGEITITQEDWTHQQSVPAFEKKATYLIDLTVHFRSDSVEFIVSQERIRETGDHRLLADRSALHKATRTRPITYVRRLPGCHPLTTAHVEGALLGALAQTHRALSPDSAETAAVAMSKLRNLILIVQEAFPHSLMTKLRDGRSLNPPTALVTQLTEIVDQISNRTSPAVCNETFQEYSCYLALEDVRRILLLELRSYAEESSKTRNMLVSMSPEMDAIFPHLGEEVEDFCGEGNTWTSCWPNEGDVKNGFLLINKRQSIVAHTFAVVDHQIMTKNQANLIRQGLM